MRACVPLVTLVTAFVICVAGGALAGASGHLHGHEEMRDAGVPAPQVSLKVTEDAVGGYNLQIVSRNFKFSPEHTGMATDAVEGHAHLYINGVKKARVYGDWFHIPGDWLNAGENKVRVTLNDNAHAVWAADGIPIAAEAVVTKAGAFAGEEISETLALDNVKTIRVTQGAEIRLILHANEALELHFHGYDLSAEATPESPAIFTFHAYHAGRFPIEAHGIKDALGRKDKALVFVEVRTE